MLLAYALPPTDLFPFIFDGKDPASWLEIDTTNCVADRLYVFNKNTEEVLLIGNDTVNNFKTTKDNIYYLTGNNKVTKTDYLGSSFTMIYQSTRDNITYMHTYGDYICFVEDSKYIVVMDIESNIAETVFVCEGISSMFMFDTDKLIWRNGEGNAFYYNITTNKTIAMEDENELSELLNPYVAPEQYLNTNTYSVRNTTTSLTAEDYNDITFPLDEYPADLQYNFNTLVNVRSFFNRGYANSYECDGFAKYAHDRFWHIRDDSRDWPSWQTANGGTTLDYHGADPGDTDSTTYNPFTDEKTTDLSTGEKLLSFFSSLKRGAFIRYISVHDESPYNGNHSIVFDGISEDGTGICAYECNQKEEHDRANAVGYQKYSFSVLTGHYIRALYYVDHEVSTSEVCANATYHKLECANCDGYLLREHEGEPVYKANAGTSGHRAAYSCCSGYATLAHTGSATYTNTGSADGHRVEYTCCTGKKTVPHTYGVNAFLCTACGYRSDAGLNSNENIVAE